MQCMQCVWICLSSFVMTTWNVWIVFTVHTLHTTAAEHQPNVTAPANCPALHSPDVTRFMGFPRDLKVFVFLFGFKWFFLKESISTASQLYTSHVTSGESFLHKHHTTPDASRGAGLGTRKIPTHTEIGCQTQQQWRFEIKVFGEILCFYTTRF